MSVATSIRATAAAYQQVTTTETWARLWAREGEAFRVAVSATQPDPNANDFVLWQPNNRRPWEAKGLDETVWVRAEGAPVTVDVVAGAKHLFHDEALVLFAAMSVKPTFGRSLLYDALIGSLIDADLWTELDCLWILAAHDAQAAHLNIKNPAANTLIPVAAPTFTPDEGYQGNGSTQYLRTGFIPATAGGVYTLDSAHIGIWSGSDIAETTVEIGASNAGNTNRVSIIPRSTGDNMIGRVNQDSSGAAQTNASSLGHHVASRTSAAGTTLYARGALVGNGGGTSTGRPTVELYLLASNNDGSAISHSTRPLLAAHVGAGLTAQEIADLNTILQAWMTAVGAL